MISRWSSPMPAISVWPVSSSVWTRKVGSSSASRARPDAELVLVGLRLRLDRDRDHRLGEGHRLEHDRRASRPTSVSPVVVCLRPTPAAISPAPISSRSSRWFACIWRMRPIRSVLPVRRVEDAVAGLELAAVDAEVGELADVRVGHDLERERRERRVQSSRRARPRPRSSGRCPGSAARRAGSAGSRSPRRAAAGRPCS